MTQGNRIGLDDKGRMCLWLTLPLPPSDNQMYENMPSRPIKRGGKTILLTGGRRLSSAGESFKKIVQDRVGELAACSPHVLLQNIPYTLILKVFFDVVENKGWPDSTQNRYKKVDATNRIKLVTDAVAEVTGVDDRHHFLTTVRKERDASNPRIELILREQEPRDGKEA